jgi:hypothetical protein
MFKQFQQKVINILEQVAMVAASNSTGGGALGPNATSLDALNGASVRDTMAVAGGTEPPKKGRRKKSKNKLKKPFFPMVKRNLPSKTF